MMDDDSKAMAFLRGVKASISEPYLYSHSWEGDGADGSHEAGMVIWVTEGETRRQYRIVVTDLMTEAEAVASYTAMRAVASQSSAEDDGGS